ncbi:MAG: hypothetical protein G01um101419_328 [Parcubacteria group bacterium Gr01-1014_19]|nr:MAG: hypothetical protein G01um101419_328 [Parcubacteria group bacterium Gr01-1014_19]
MDDAFIPVIGLSAIVGICIGVGSGIPLIGVGVGLGVFLLVCVLSGIHSYVKSIDEKLSVKNKELYNSKGLPACGGAKGDQGDKVDING